MKTEKFEINNLKKIGKEKCFICKSQISKEELIFEDKNFIVFLDLYPPTKAYTIVAPKKHFEDVSEFSEKEYLEFQKLVYKISFAIKKAFNPKRICLLNSGGLLNHFHFHLIPVYKEMYNNFLDIILKKEILKFSREEKMKIVSKIQRYL